MDRAAAAAPPEQDFRHQYRDADDCDTGQINQNEGAAAVLTHDVGKLPDIAQPHCRAGRCEDEGQS